MTKEQKQYKALILSDLRIVSSYYDDADKSMRLQAAYHMQQAVEKTIKLKAEIEGLNLWGHDIRALLKECNDHDIDIQTPRVIIDKEKMITGWEAECRYYPVKVIRRDSIKLVYDALTEWLEEGKTASRKRNK